MAIAELNPGAEFQTPPRTTGEQIAEILTGHSPVFFQSVDTYEQTMAKASQARAELKELIDPADPDSAFEDNKSREHYLKYAKTNPDDPGVKAYIRRDHLQELVYKGQDVSSLIRKEGNEIVAALKTTLSFGPHFFGAGFYFLEVDPHQETYPNRINFYRVDSEEPHPEFGDTLRYPVYEPFRRASEADLVQLINDLRPSVISSQQAQTMLY